uniref:MFS domain-containing protein n=1 Tax=Bursaphelenchus xylophilus TaxID=6326 RepID=A0A1I7S7S3_BURXY
MAVFSVNRIQDESRLVSKSTMPPVDISANSQDTLQTPRIGQGLPVTTTTTLPGLQINLEDPEKPQNSEPSTRSTSILSSDKSLNEAETAGFFCCGRTRYIVMLVSILCLSSVIANSLALNFTVICMKCTDSSNGTEIKRDMFTDFEKSWLYSAIAMGTILGTFPITYLTSTLGVRKTFTMYGGVSAIATLLTPLAAEAGFFAVFLARFMQGFAVATSWPAMGSIIADWATWKRSGTYVAYLSCHLQFGPMLSMFLGGMFCHSEVGWAALYYLLGGLTIVTFSLFYGFYRDSPTIHKNVSSKELKTITKNKTTYAPQRNGSVKIPYKAIFTDWTVIGILMTCFSSNLGYLIFNQYGPVYLNKVLGFEVKKTGMATALPYIIGTFVKILAGPCSDSVPYLGNRGRVILFATVSQFLMGACFVALAFCPAGMPELAQVFFTSAMVFSALNCVGVSKCTQLISGRYVHFLMALNSFTNSTIVLILPFVIEFLAPDNTRAQWTRVLVGITVIVVSFTLVFDFNAKGEPRPWAIESSVTSDPIKVPTISNACLVELDANHLTKSEKDAELQ